MKWRGKNQQHKQAYSHHVAQCIFCDSNILYIVNNLYLYSGALLLYLRQNIIKLCLLNVRIPICWMYWNWYKYSHFSSLYMTDPHLTYPQLCREVFAFWYFRLPYIVFLTIPFVSPFPCFFDKLYYFFHNMFFYYIYCILLYEHFANTKGVSGVFWLLIICSS